MSPPGLNFGSRKRRSLLRFALFLVGASILAIVNQPRWQPWAISPDLARANSVLWITAHPDDESFFFAPTILALVNPPAIARGSLLCLSTGDYEGAGSIRQLELQDSCRILGIDASRCLALDHPNLRDGPEVKWPADTILSLVKEHIDTWQADAIITFDSYGVSGHANHRALSEALSRAVRSQEMSIPVYSIRSSNVVAKYTSVALLPIAIAKHFLSATLAPVTRTSSLFVSSPRAFALARGSFAAHKSQARWFRTLFINASRYLWYVRVDRVV